MPIDAEKMMLGRADRNYPARLAHQGLDRQVVDQILE